MMDREWIDVVRRLLGAGALLAAISLFVIAANIVPRATTETTVEISGHLLSTSTCCGGDWVIQLHEYNKAFYANHDLVSEELRQAFEQDVRFNDELTVLAYRRWLMDDPTADDYRATPLAGVWTDERVYVDPAIMQNADFVRWPVVLGSTLALYGGLLLLPDIFSRIAGRVGFQPA